MPDTPLGRVIAIRAERDPDAVARMGAGELDIREDWARRNGHQDLQRELDRIFGKGGMAWPG